ncbi:MAG: peroxide stress protein YaaA [Deltaproteobacteria bacterium]|nr:peroxide stress protein YaaA [Deltaproteobacteria bacterium]
MLVLLSPAKTLNFEKERTFKNYTLPLFLHKSALLIEKLREMTPDDISSLMKLGEKLADLNYERFQDWSIPFTPENAKAAIMAFTGDVYEGLNAREFNDEDFDFTQNHLRILSGLYGILKPLDLIQPYRLEIGLSLCTFAGKNLYSFWGNTITDAINDSVKGEEEPVLINLASQEYFKAVNKNALRARLITPVFKELRDGKYRIISFSAKKARGLMANYIIKNRLTDADHIKSFHAGSYSFKESISSGDEWIFTRER